MSHLSLRNRAAFLAAAAVIRAYPKAELLQEGASDLGFKVAFFLQEEPALPVLEEHLRAVLTENQEIQLHEMVPKVASEWLKSKRQFRRAEEALSQKGLVTVVSLGSFIDLAEPPLEGTVKWVQLLSLQRGREGAFLLEGVVFPDKEELKLFQKARKEASVEPPVLEEEEGVLAPEAVKAEERLYDLWREFVAEMGALRIKTPAKGDFEGKFLKSSPLVAEWKTVSVPLTEMQFSKWGRPRVFVQDFIHGNFSEALLKSSLHFLLRWIKILELKGKWRFRVAGKGAKELKAAASDANISFEETTDRAILDPSLFFGPQLQFVFTDELQREWGGPYIGVTESLKGEKRISLSLLGPFNRTLFAGMRSGRLLEQ